MYYSSNATQEWIWASLGIMLALAGAWSGMIEVLLAAVVILIFLAPFLAEDSEPQSSSEWFTKTRLTRISALVISNACQPVPYVDFSHITESIDTVNFDAHELYGAPFLLGFAGAMVIYTRRKSDPKKQFMH